MKINKVKFYTAVFILLLFAQMYLPSFKINTFLQLGAISLFFLLERARITYKVLYVISPLLLIFLLGFLGSFIYHNPLTETLKDIFHFIKPILGVLIGYFFYQVINDKKVFIKTIIISGLLSAFVHFVILLFFSDLSNGSVSSIREFARDNYLELTALFFLLFYNRFFKTPIFSSVIKRRFFIAILILSCFLYFSRTMMVLAIIMTISVYGYAKIDQKSIKIIAFFMLLIGLLYAYLYSASIERDKPGLEAFLYKVKIAPEELFKTKINRENHEHLWDHWRGYEAKRALALMSDYESSYLIGMGHGSLVNLKFRAPLTDDGKGMRYISELHNGYMYVFYKIGIFGIVIYVFFLLVLYRQVYAPFSFESVFISAISLIYFFTTLTITGIYNTKDIFVFILGGLLFFNSNSKKELKES